MAATCANWGTSMVLLAYTITGNSYSTWLRRELSLQEIVMVLGRSIVRLAAIGGAPNGR